MFRLALVTYDFIAMVRLIVDGGCVSEQCQYLRCCIDCFAIIRCPVTTTDLASIVFVARYSHGCSDANVPRSIHDAQQHTKALHLIRASLGVKVTYTMQSSNDISSRSIKNAPNDETTAPMKCMIDSLSENITPTMCACFIDDLQNILVYGKMVHRDDLPKGHADKLVVLGAEVLFFRQLDQCANVLHRLHCQLARFILRFSISVGRSCHEVVLQKDADGQKWNEGQDGQGQLPREDEGENNASTDGEDVAEHGSDANATRSSDGRRFCGETSAQRSSAVRGIVEKCHVLSKHGLERFCTQSFGESFARTSKHEVLDGSHE